MSRNSKYFLFAVLMLNVLAPRQPAAAQDKDESNENPSARERFRFLQRADNNGQIPPNALINAKKQADEMRARQAGRMGMNTVQSAQDAGLWNWEWLGPGNIGGRIRAILIHPTIPGTMWIGSVSGGIWRTDNSGGSWYPISDFMANLGVTSLVMDPTNTSIMYASTGEGFFPGSTAAQGAGVFKSTDAGLTWNQLPQTAGWIYVMRLSHHPTAANTVLAATSDGVYRTTDQGLSWQLTLGVDAKQVKYHPTNPSLVLCGTSADFYLSTNGGIAWHRASNDTTGLPSSPGRCEGDFSLTDNRVYLNVDRNQGEVWRSTNSGQTWTLRNTGNGYMGGQGAYNNAIWIDPTNSDFILVAGRNLQRSTNGGQSLALIGGLAGVPAPNVHSDIHAFVSSPQFNGTTNKTVFVGCDGGIYGTTDIQTVSSSSGWMYLNNNLGITQFYSGAASTDGSLIAGGAQDNDRLHFTPARGVNGWYVGGGTAPGGDGTTAVIDFTNPQRVYMEATGLSVQRSDDGGATYNSKQNGISDAGLWVSPLVMDPNNANTLVAGGAKIWITADAANNWNLIRAALAGSPKCSAIDVAKGNSNNIWVGYDNGLVSRTFDGGGLWTDAAGLPAGRLVTDIAINPSNNAEVVVTFGGYRNDCVWMTANGGLDWTQRTGSGITALPAIQVNTVRYHPLNTNWLYIGTDIGIFASEDKGLTWNSTPHFVGNDGPVNVEVDELFWQGTDYLVAATFGRGMFRSRPRVAVYVNLDNLNSGDGSPENPYRLLQDGINAQGNGTPLFIKSGTYQQGSLIFDRRGQLVPQNGPVVVR